MQKHDVEVNLLCVVNRAVARSPQKVYASLKKLGVRHLQFIACLDPIEGERGAQPWALTPEAYGKFLCGLFDVYYRDWVNGDYTSVRLFDDYIHMAMGMPAGTCATSGSCGAYFVVEGDGTVYPCDFYCLDEWEMGRIGEQSIPELANSEKARLFCSRASANPMPAPTVAGTACATAAASATGWRTMASWKTTPALRSRNFLPMPKAGFWRSHGRKRNTIGGRK